MANSSDKNDTKAVKYVQLSSDCKVVTAETIENTYDSVLAECKSLRIRSAKPVTSPKEEVIKDSKDCREYQVNLVQRGWSLDRKILEYICCQYKPLRCSPGNEMMTFHFKDLWKAKYLMRWGPEDKFLIDQLSVVQLWMTDDADHVQQPEAALKSETPSNANLTYFKSYGRLTIHRSMLQDYARMTCYTAAIKGTDMVDLTVMDVGCGTGILSMLSAKNGASKVYAIDNSDIIETTKLIVQDNQLENKIDVVRSIMEDVEGIPEKSVDVIVSEWMGYGLLYERMLPSVLYARDKWLKPHGKLLPNRARVFVSGFYDPDYVRKRLSWTDKIWEIDRSATADYVCQQIIVESVPQNCVATSCYEISNLNLESCSKDLTEIESFFTLNFYPGNYILDGLILYFSVEFEHLVERVTLSTAPDSAPTHWRQALLLFKRPLDRACNMAEPIVGNMKLMNKGMSRSLDIDVKIEDGKNSIVQSYFLE